jgi:hypothetical protein
MLLSIIFLITDIFVTALANGPSGINPYWRVSPLSFTLFTHPV